MKKTALSLIVISFLFACQRPGPVREDVTREAKIKVAIMYPATEGERFDMDYYANNHMPMVANLFGDSLVSYTIDKGISGRTGEEPATFVAIGAFYFEKLSAYQNSFGPNANKILSDIPNYTAIQPVVQISKVIK